MASFPYVDYARKTMRAIISSVTNVACLGCGLPGARLCMDCTKKIPRTRQRCIGCLQPRKDGLTCARCIEQRSIHRVLTASAYRTRTVKRAIKMLKYRYDRSLVRPLAMRTLTALHDAPHQLDNPLFVPVPLHTRRRNWRGFNQASLLAKACADIGLFSYAEPLRRTRNTEPQTKTLSRAERMNAMEGAFSCSDSEAVQGRHIILVDDVCTTGATLDACSNVLLASGARTVTGLVIARG